ncbi:MAG: 23S rRNA (uracil(1939)-C(5))-methyltransferase RlmD [Erysipelotrichaceae bacterium]|nr:23S rRNA (uracil(1939)-C(5))-methyltransferase RlmD [Erysipelotrichaceae bacterium]MBQ3994373.1 23S rRNA (uracil(1939)-C(5))-methyltransferase RlmD [Erysipelotrichaceae bacterium]
MKLEIVKAGINGEGIAFFKRKPVFIEGCFPDEVVDADLIDEGRHYKGRLKAVLKKSPERIKPVCSYADKCGACALMGLKYDGQLAIKMQLLENALYKYAEYEGKIEGIVRSDDVYGYRNKCNLPIIDYNGKLVNALYKQGSNHPCLITTCFIHEESVEEIRRKILDVLNRYKLQAYDRREKKGMRQLIVRAFDKGAQAVLVTGNDTLKENVIADLKKIKGLKSLFQGINTVRDPIRMMPEKLRPLFGKEKIEVKSLNYELELSPQAFFQLNHKQAEQIYKDAAALIKEKQKLIIEGYCGIGTISLAMHDKAEKIIGIEIIEKAIKDAKDNAKKNKVENVEFRCGDAAKEIRKIVEKEKADVIVVDPPRTGLDDELLKTLLKSKAKQIIYISCNPSTLGKDLYILKKEYEIHLVRGYDMFPNTPLVETLVELVRR